MEWDIQGPPLTSMHTPTHSWDLDEKMSPIASWICALSLLLTVVFGELMEALGH